MKNKLLVLVGALIALLMLPATARAAADCDTRVVDDFGAFTASGFVQVDTAAKNLAAQGAEVRVRTVRDFGGSANLDQYESSLLSQCRSWQGTNGKMKNNMVVLMLSLGSKRGVGLYYGNQWKPTLDAKWPGILAAKVKPKAAASVGDYSGALTDGLNQVALEIGAQTVAPAPQPRPSPPIQVTPVVPATPPVIVNQPPGPDHTVLWVFVLVGLLGAGVLIWFLLRRKSQREAARAAQQQAIVQQNACSAKVNELEEDVSLLDVKVSQLATLASEEDVAALRAEADDIKRTFGSASSRNADLAGTVSDPTRDGLSQAEYVQIGAGYGGILTTLEGVKAALTTFHSNASAFQKRIGDAPKQIDEAAAAVATATRDIGDVAKQGFKTVDANIYLTSASGYVDKAKTALAAKKYGEVAGFVSSAKADATKATASAKALAQKKIDADAAAARLKQRIESTSSSVPSAKDAYRQVSTTFVEKSWSDIGGKTAETDSAVAEASKFLAAAVTGASMDKQNWDASAAAVKNGNAALDRADAAMGAIRGRKRDLEAAKADAPKMLDRADAAIELACKYAREHAADVGTSVDADLTSAMATVKGARTELAAKTPDYLSVIAGAGNAKRKADDALEAATKKYRAAEALRQRAASAIAEASEAIGTAGGYVREHGSDVDIDPTAALRDARASLARAQSASTLTSRIELADAAKAKAEAVLTTAQGQVRAAQARRAEEARLAELERQRLAAEAERQRQLEQQRLDQQRRDADAAAALLTGVVVGSALSSANRSEDSYGRQSRRDDDDDGQRFGGGSVSLDDDSSKRDDGGSFGGGSVSLDDDSSSGADTSTNDDNNGNNGGSSDI